MSTANIVRLQIPWPNLSAGIVVDTSHFTLEIPLIILSQNAKHLRRLLLYIAWAVYGQQGTLSLSDGLPFDDAQMNPEVFPDETYIFHPSVESRTLCDIKGGDDRNSVDSEYVTPGDLRDLVSEREGRRCVLVNPPAMAPRISSGVLPSIPSDNACQAIHILPHARGDEYIESVFTTRLQTDQWGNRTEGTPAIESIDDLRNMVFLDAMLHRGMINSQFAFLVVPNAALSLDDIQVNTQDAAPQPNLGNVQWQIIDPGFYDNYHFRAYDTAGCVWNNKFPRLPQDSKRWPPFFVFHFWYGVSALTHWLKDEAAREVLERAMADDYRVGDSDRRAHGLQVSPGFSTDVVAMMWKSSTPKVVEDTSATRPCG